MLIVGDHLQCLDEIEAIANMAIVTLNSAPGVVRNGAPSRPGSVA
jgi:hypothetical protein